jgi:flavin reductase (DIM6/NTAB) family NADH-FMN oxidoreductase RutF
MVIRGDTAGMPTDHSSVYAIATSVSGSERPPRPLVDSATYRQAISHFATGVSVITAVNDRGDQHGMTANAVASVSLSPVLLLVCIAHDLPTHRAVRMTGRFNLSLLRADQVHLARQFACPAPDKFAGVRLLDGKQPPVLADALAHFECELYNEFIAGDHSVFIGRVESCESHADPSVDPLVYYRCGYHSLVRADGRSLT